MNKILQLLCIVFLLSTSVAYSQNVYVATNGNDANNGTINSPFKTFNKAVSVMSAGSVCIIRGGIYTEELSVSKSGTAGNYLTFKAADGEDVKIKATSTVNGWQLHSGNIYKANVTMSLDRMDRTVYHNDVYMDLARWPNNTDDNRWTLNSVPVTGDGGAKYYSLEVETLPNIDWTGGLVYYVGAHSGTSWTREINSTSASTNGMKIAHKGVQNKWPFNPHNPSVWRDYPGNNRGQLYLFDKLEALDYANEWYYDSNANVLYLQTANGNKPNDGEVSYASNRYTASITGNYVKIEGIQFFGGSVLLRGTNNIFQNNEVIHGSEGHDDLTNTSANIGKAGVEVLGANTIIKGNTINHNSANGIVIQNYSGAHNVIIEGNTISNSDYLGIHTTPIRALANNAKILKNTIVNAARDGMYVSGNDSEVAYNDISHSQLINSDSGVFYTVGNSTLKNIEIHHNWFHDATAQTYSHEVDGPGKAVGIYLDNDSQGFTVHHNVIWNVSWSGYQVNWNNEKLDFFHNSIWNAERAMDSWVNGYEQADNKVYNNYANTGDWFRGNGTHEFDLKNNIITTTQQLEDPANKKFMPSDNGFLKDIGRVITGFTKPFQGNAPDIGAYEKGGTEWTAGVNAIEDTGAPLSVSSFDTEIALKIYPNPATSFLNINLSDNQNFGKISVKIYSILGQVVKTVSIDNSISKKRISVDELPKGVYMLRVQNENRDYTGKFIKN